MDARAAGGALSLYDLDRLYSKAAGRRRILCVGEEPELRQMQALLSRSLGSSVVTQRTRASSPEGHIDAAGFDLVAIVETVSGRPLHRSADCDVILLGSKAADVESMRQSYKPRLPRAQARADDHVRVVILNDEGFQRGSGTAVKRQAASFLLNGWDVGVIAWDGADGPQMPMVTGIYQFLNWYGLRSFSRAERDACKTTDEIVSAILAKFPFDPDFVIVGNLHGAEWPLEVLARLRQAVGPKVIVYMHDAYWVTGRCAQPGSCTLYKSGCDATCPTATEYPRLAPARIRDAWSYRARLFTGEAAIPLVANSSWTEKVARQRYGSTASIDTIHLGLDEHLYAPSSKEVARRILGLPQDRKIVAMGAVSLENQWKGGPLFATVHRQLSRRNDTGIILFGSASHELPCERQFGFVRDERVMPLIYSAADVYVTTATAESFGQTILEASACGVPVVAFDVGGIKDIVIDGENGFLVKERSASSIVGAAEQLICDDALRRRMGQNGRTWVEQHFTLRQQARYWANYLDQCRLRSGVAEHGAIERLL